MSKLCTWLLAYIQHTYENFLLTELKEVLSGDYIFPSFFLPDVKLNAIIMGRQTVQKVWLSLMFQLIEKACLIQLVLVYIDG